METFAKVIRPMTYKCVFEVSIKYWYRICQMNLVTTFLYRFLDKVIYVEQPHLFELNPPLVCRLRQALYGLKQALLVWYQTIANFIIKWSFEQLKLDHGVFVSKDRQLSLALYIDDLLPFTPDKARLTKIQVKLSVWFEKSDLGEISDYSCMEVDVEIGMKIPLRQTTYIMKILKHFQISDCKPVSIPMNQGVANSFLPLESQPDKVTIKWYQSAISSCIWLSSHTWPDISN